MAKGAPVDRTITLLAGTASATAIVVALLALLLAAMAWPKELRWVRLSTLCLAVGALLWSLVAV
jgi:hypothetical protein